MHNRKPFKTDRTLHHNSTFLSNLPEDVLKNHIGPHLGLKAMSRFANSAKRLSTLFKGPLKEAKESKEAEPLLLCIAQGKQDEAEEMIKKNPSLLLFKSKTKDYSDRAFEDITAFQLALWYKDTNMWKMLLKYLPDVEAKKQLQEHLYVATKYKKANGDSFDFTPLINALQTYVANYRLWNDEEREVYWCQVVGQAQKMVAVHVANHYCYTLLPFNSTRTFEEKPLQARYKAYKESGWNVDFRNLNISILPSLKCELWFPNINLGTDFAIFRQNGIAGAVPAYGGPEVDSNDVSENLAAIITLSEKSIKEIKKLTENLLKPVNNNCLKL